LDIGTETFHWDCPKATRACGGEMEIKEKNRKSKIQNEMKT
jgi:hypothetical protein